MKEIKDVVVLMCNYGFRDITLNLIKSIENQYVDRQEFRNDWIDKFLFFALDERTNSFFQAKSIESVNLSNRSTLGKCFEHQKPFIKYSDQLNRSLCQLCHDDNVSTTTSSIHIRDQYNNSMNIIKKEAVERPMTSVNDMMACFGGSLTAGNSENTIKSADTVYGEEAESYGNVGFRAICNEKPLVVLDVLKRGYNVLWTDTDIVWLSDPFASFKRAAKSIGLSDSDYDSLDLIVQQDDDDICAGFYYIRSNSRTIKYMETVIAFLNPVVDDQISMRKFLREQGVEISKNNNINNNSNNNSKIQYLRLPRTTFPNGTAYFNLKIPQRNNVDPVIVHNNCIIGHRSKKDRFIEYNLWYVDDTKDIQLVNDISDNNMNNNKNGDVKLNIKIQYTSQFKAHFDVITSITRDSESNLLYTASLDKSVKIWDCQSGKLLKSKYIHKRGSIWGLETIRNAFKASNSSVAENTQPKMTLVTASHDKTVQCWDSEFNSLQSYGGHYGIINGMLIINNNTTTSDNDMMFITWSDDRTIRVTSFNDPSFRRVYLGHSGVVSSVDYYNSQLFSASSDSSIRQWDFSSGRCTNIIHSHQGWVRSIIYDHLNNQLISAGSDGSIKVWNIKTNECIKSIYPNLNDNENISISQIKLFEGVLYVASENGALKSYNLSNCELIDEFEGHTPSAINCMYISPTNRTLYTGGFDKLVKAWPLSKI